jgi:hypothetical protein
MHFHPSGISISLFRRTVGANLPLPHKQVLVSPTYNLTVGTPVANCDPSSNSSLQETIGGSVSIADAWSVNVSLGIAAGGLNIGGAFGWSTTKTIQWSQSVTASIPPGQIVRHPFCSFFFFFFADKNGMN